VTPPAEQPDPHDGAARRHATPAPREGADGPGPAPARERLHKALADAGVASRRKCEQFIADGRVRVNGEAVTELPAWYTPGQDTVEVDGEVVLRPRRPHGTGSNVYIVLHKPRRYVSTTDDPQGRPTVLDLLPPEVRSRARLYPVGRLDAESTGLVLLTNDGDLAHHLMHPRFGVARQYLVAVRGQLTDEDVEALQHGLYLADRAKGVRKGVGARKATMTKVRRLQQHRDRSRGDRTHLAVTLHEGQNREIRRMLARLGYKVARLRRTAIGPIALKGLAVGQWRFLAAGEVRQLQEAGGGQADVRGAKAGGAGSAGRRRGGGAGGGPPRGRGRDHSRRPGPPRR
jgi:pseudouridine synthase